MYNIKVKITSLDGKTIDNLEIAPCEGYELHYWVTRNGDDAVSIRHEDELGEILGDCVRTLKHREAIGKLDFPEVD